MSNVKYGQSDTQPPYRQRDPNTDHLHFRRESTHRNDFAQIHPRSEIVTSCERSYSAAGGHHSHPNYVEDAGPIQPQYDESLLSMDALSLESLQTSHVRNGSESSEGHSPREETVTDTGWEECVPNTAVDPSASRFREHAVPRRPDTAVILETVQLVETTAPPAAASRPEILYQRESDDVENSLNGFASEDSEIGRLYTFPPDWDHPFISAEALANAGFVYTDQSRESVRQELIADTAVRPSDPDQSPTNDNIAAAAASGGLQEPRLGSTYEERLQTFVNWENEFISPVVLAWAGFIFTGPGDTVACVGGCGGTLKDWRAGDNPLELHRLYFNGDCFPVDD